MIELNNFVCGDCMDYLPQFPDKYFELAIVDPPYGINIQKSGRLKKYNTGEIWDDKPPDKEYFNELFRVSKNQVIWGGNYFGLPATKCFLIWDKKQPEDISFASCEYAWTSFSTSAKTFYFSPFSDKEKRFHTSQKPIELYDWILAKYAKQGDKILDTHVGSASSLIACYKNGFDYIGFEKDPYYYDLANKRLEEYKSQITLFDIGMERK